MTAVAHTIPPEEVMAYADGELPPDRAALVGRHVSECDACQQLIAGFREVSRDLTQWSPQPPLSLRPPAGAVNSAPRAAWFGWRRPLLASRQVAATVLAAGAIAVLWVGSWQPRMRVAVSEAGTSPRSDVAATRLGGALAQANQPEFRTGVNARAAGEALQGQPATVTATPARTPRIVRTISLSVVIRDVAAARPAIDRILREVSGFVGQIQVSAVQDDARWLRATLRVPAARVDEAVQSLRALGTVTDENQSGDDVTEQIVDLEARLTNNRNTERRLNEVLKNRTGNVAQVLEVEREIARVRSEIERLDAQRANVEERVSYATITLQVTEERRSALLVSRLPLSSRLRDAFVDGIRRGYESAIAAVLVALQVAPVLLLWIGILWWPARKAMRALTSASPGTSES